MSLVVKGIENEGEGEKKGSDVCVERSTKGTWVIDSV